MFGPVYAAPYPPPADVIESKEDGLPVAPGLGLLVLAPPPPIVTV
jgi:hypothetical protein